MVSAIFFLFAGLAIACAISCVYNRNPLYSAVSLVGVFISLSVLYVTLAAPFIAAVQILIYAGAIMVLVVFVIMLLNLEEEDARNRLSYLYAIGGALGVFLLVQTFFIFYAVLRAPKVPVIENESVGKTLNIGASMYTQYLLPVEIVGILLLMAVIGGVILARRIHLQPRDRIMNMTAGDMTVVNKVKSEVEQKKEAEKRFG